MAYTSPRFQAQLSITLEDLSDERSSVAIYVPEDVVIEDANGNGIPDDALIAAWDTALASICDYAPVRYGISQATRLTLATGGFGQREQKYLFKYVDDVTGEKYELEVPCRDASINPPAHTDEYNLAVAPWIAVKSAFEALAVSKVGNAVTLTHVKLMGKNN